MARVSDPFAMSNVLSAASLTAIIINSLIVVRWGRRRVLLMAGLSCCGIFQLIVAIVYQQAPGTSSTGQVIVALSCLYMVAYNGMIGKIPSPTRFSGAVGEGSTFEDELTPDPNSNVRLGGRRRDPIAAPAQLHVRPGRGRGLLRRLADDLYGALLHQPRIARLGTALRLHLVPVVRHLGPVGLLLPARDQGPDARGDRRDGKSSPLPRPRWSLANASSPLQFEAKLPARKFRQYKCIGRVAQLSREESSPERTYSNEKVRFGNPAGPPSEMA